MNQQERSQVGELWLAVASMYGREIGRAALGLMLDAVSDLGANDVAGVLQNWVRTAKNRSHPLPGDIRSILAPIVDPEAMAREIAGRCVEAIKKFGWPQPEKAKEFIGDEGWSVIQSTGGWNYFCEQHGVGINPGQFFAQARDRVKDQLTYGRSAIVAGFIEPRNKEGGLQRLFSTPKLIDNPKDFPT